jgi:uncharacterized protein YdeI (BOF family)
LTSQTTTAILDIPTKGDKMMTVDEVTRLIQNAFPEMYVFEDKTGEIVVCTGEYVNA